MHQREALGRRLLTHTQFGNENWSRAAIVPETWIWDFIEIPLCMGVLKKAIAGLNICTTSCLLGCRLLSEATFGFVSNDNGGTSRFGRYIISWVLQLDVKVFNISFRQSIAASRVNGTISPRIDGLQVCQSFVHHTIRCTPKPYICPFLSSPRPPQPCAHETGPFYTEGYNIPKLTNLRSVSIRCT